MDEHAQEMLKRYRAARSMVLHQAEDEELWFMPETITEDYLQRALRRLHRVIEGEEDPGQ